MPWRLENILFDHRRPILPIALNLRYRRPFWSRRALASLHRFVDPRRVSPTSIPIVINNFNRLESLRILVDWVRSLDGETSIIILDNASTYPPVRAFYRTLKAPNEQVVRLGYNSGLEGIADVAQELRGFRRFVVTDPDLVPYPDTPRDILKRMDVLLDRYPQFTHVGASIEIRDLPPTYPLREEVEEWESQFWPPKAAAVGSDGWEAWVDTTFAMYRGDADVRGLYTSMRMDRPYTLRHVDWYLDPTCPTEEQKHYLAVSKSVASWAEKLRKSHAAKTGSFA